MLILLIHNYFANQSEKDYDPFADRRRPTIADREDEYRQKRRRMIISPERVDPFAEGWYLFSFKLKIIRSTQVIRH